jgi:UDP-glucose 4-epimerase
MRILITGGLGYVGGRIVAAMASRPGIGLRVLIHGSRPIPPGFPASVEVCRGDVRDPENLRGVCAGITHVVHLAGLDQAASRKFPTDALMVSGIGTWHLAEEAAGAGVERFLFLSTIHVYGEVSGDRLQETTAPFPTHPYAIARLAGEGFARQAAREHGLSVVILRVSNGYGPPAFPGTACWELVVNDVCRQAVRRGEIILRGGGKDARNFVAVTDVVRAIELFLGSHDTGPNHVFNIGGENLRTVLEVAECARDAWADHTGHRVPIRLGNGPNPSKPAVSVDLSCARRIGYSPQVNFREEIQRTLIAAAGPLAEDGA